MNMQCALCSGKNFTRVEKVNFGLWNTENTEIVRENNESEIVICKDCHHVQMMADYTPETFSKLYFSGEQEEVFWHEQLVGSVQPYASMVQFFSEYLDSGSIVADFGCGPGKLLQAIKDFKPEITNLYGVDFNDRCELEGIQYKSADLNDLDQLQHACDGALLDLACASHTLEHVVNPRSFLLGLKKQLKPNGLIFIEVPDFSLELESVLVGQCNLVNLQHIHYFTRDSLVMAGSLVGLKAISIKQMTTGYIPRLQVIFKIDDSVANGEKVIQSAQFMIQQIQNHGRAKRKELFNRLEKSISQGSKVALWGIGADFYLLIKEIPEMASLLESDSLYLFDYALAAKTINSKVIHSSNDIPQFDGDVYILPSLAETRFKMNALAVQWKGPVLDMYDTSIEQVSSASVVACQVCQNKNWQLIETLYSGKWQKNEDEITRKEIDFPIGECAECHHVQVMRPYTDEVIKDLYFSTNQQPDMWCSSASEKTPYDEMVDFFAEYLDDAQTIADFGCGEGLMLKAISERNSNINLEGFDFNIQGDQINIQRSSCDLNSDASIREATKEKSFSLVLTSHVLEHVFNPPRFIKAITDKLDDQGYLFIEVPDSTYDESASLQYTNLVHGQHIHYYTLESLEKIAARAGFRCVKNRRFSTGIIPRLQMLFQREVGVEDNFIVNSGARAAIDSRFEKYQKSQKNIKNTLDELLQNNAQVGLWGIGGDFHLLIKTYPDLLEKIEAEKIILFDLELAGLNYKGKMIHSSTEIQEFDFPVVISPLYAPTRDKMSLVSKAWKTDIIDPNNLG